MDNKKTLDAFNDPRLEAKELGAWILMKLAAYAEILKRLNDRTNAQEKRLRELVDFITKEGM